MSLNATSLRRVLEIYGRLVERHIRTGLHMSRSEYALVAEALYARAPSAALIFGCGDDSPMWGELNHGGRTLFVEDSPQWAAAARNVSLDVILVHYACRLNEWMAEVHVPSGLDEDILCIPWDVVLVDAPLGVGNSPGREQSIYTASVLQERHGSAVLVHDYQRGWERACCDRYFGSPRTVLERLAYWPAPRVAAPNI